jgi:hypothetical protein
VAVNPWLVKGVDCINCNLGSPGSAPVSEPPPVGTLPPGQSTWDSTVFPDGTVTPGPVCVTIDRDGPIGYYTNGASVLRFQERDL